MPCCAPTWSFAWTGSRTIPSTSRSSRLGSTGWWATSSMPSSGASRSASSTSCRNGWTTTWYRVSMWIRSENSSCGTKLTSPAIPGMNIQTCFLWDLRPIWGCWPRLHLGSSTNVTPRATGHSSPRYSACPYRNISMTPTTTSPASGPWRMRLGPEAWHSSFMLRIRNSNSQKPETRRGRLMCTNGYANGATTKSPS